MSKKLRYSLSKAAMSEILEETHDINGKYMDSFHKSFLRVLYNRHPIVWKDVMNSRSWLKLQEDKECLDIIIELSSHG